jgi:integrase
VFRPTVLAIRKEKDMRRARHQKGSLQRVQRKSGEAVWIFRWYEVQLDGAKRYRKAVIGSVQEYKTEAEAQRAADALRLEINEQTPRQQLQAISMETLVEHYRQHELPDIVGGTRPLGSEAGEDETRKAFSTQTTYQGYLRKWILPRWRSYRLADVKAVQVEQWLKSLPVSRGTKAKVRNIMSAL